MAGCAVGYRGRVSAKCHCDVSGGLSEVELMREDMLASGLNSPKVLLCGPCADAYDSRRESAGCASCGAALRQDIKLPPTYSNVE